MYESARTTLSSAFFISVLLALYLPVQLHSSNANYMHFPLRDHLILFASVGAIIFLCLSLAYFIVLFASARQLFSGLLAVLALFAWLNSFLLTRNHGELDGTGLDLSISAPAVLVELALLAVVLVIVFYAFRIRPFLDRISKDKPGHYEVTGPIWRDSSWRLVYP